MAINTEKCQSWALDSCSREALVKRYPRDSFMLATKLPAWEIKSESDIDRIFEEAAGLIGS